MKNLLLLFFFVISISQINAQLSGDYYIPQGSHSQGFATLADAFTAVNTQGVSGTVVLYIDDNLNEVGSNLVLYRGDLSSTNNLVIKPAPTKTPTIDITGCASSGHQAYAGITIDSTSYVTIDGSNTFGGSSQDLTISMSDGTNGRIIVQAYGNADNIEIKNCVLKYNQPPSSATASRGVYVNGQSTGVTDNFVVENCMIGDGLNDPAYAVSITGSSSASLFCSNISIKNNVLYGTLRRVYFFNVGTSSSVCEISGNMIYGLNAPPSGNVVWGILFNAYGGTINIFNNKLHSLRSVTTGTQGIYAFGTLNGSANTVLNIYNNFFGGDFVHSGTGIPASVDVISFQDAPTGAVVNLYFNTVVLNNMTQQATGRMTCLRFNPVAGSTFNIKNNIFINYKDTTISSVLYFGGSALTFASDNNLLYASGSTANIGYFNSTLQPTLSDWQTATGQDSASVSKDVSFISQTDFHLTGSSDGDIDLLGIPLGGLFTFDIDNETRNTLYPYKGADEGTKKLIYTIAEAREDLNNDLIPDRLNDTLTIRGIVISPNYQTTNHSYYIWDGTAGITEFLGGTTSPVLNLGDEVQMTGIIGQFRGLTQIQPFNSGSITLLSSGNPTPDPVVLTMAEYMQNPESYEGTLIGFVSVNKVSGNWPSNGSATLVVTDGTDTIDLRIDSDTDLDNNPEPTWPVDIIGLGSQFSSGSTVLNDGYQLLPRYYATDILPAGTIPVELSSFVASVSNGKVILSWATITETNNKGFAVEKSSGSEFEQIGFVDGKGTTTEKQFYTFTDNTPGTGVVRYRLKQIDFNGTYKYSDIVEVDVNIPAKFDLAQNYPNPFNPSTTIRYTIGNAVNVSLVIYNTLGEEVITLVNNQFTEPGVYNVVFDASNLASGTYIYRLIAGDFVMTKKMVLMK